MAHLDRVILVPVFLLACGSPEPVEPATHEGDETTVTRVEPGETGETIDPTIEEMPADPPVAAGDSAVVGRVVDSGPIGSGNCVQCSHQIVVEAATAGDLAAGAEPLWVHYESCVDRPMPPPGPASLNPCSLDEGSSYDLTLRPGASPNFGDAFMIMDARPH